MKKLLLVIGGIMAVLVVLTIAGSMLETTPTATNAEETRAAMQADRHERAQAVIAKAEKRKQELELPSEEEAIATIRAKCQSDWSEDFSMRAWCEKEQKKAVAVLRARDMAGHKDLETIRIKCRGDWAKDFTMWDWCEKEQLKALKELLGT